MLLFVTDLFVEKLVVGFVVLVTPTELCLRYHCEYMPSKYLTAVPHS